MRDAIKLAKKRYKMFELAIEKAEEATNLIRGRASLVFVNDTGLSFSMPFDLKKFDDVQQDILAAGFNHSYTWDSIDGTDHQQKCIEFTKDGYPPICISLDATHPSATCRAEQIGTEIKPVYQFECV